MSLTHEDVVKIVKIVDECDYDEFRLESGDLKIHLRKSAGGTEPRDESPRIAERSPDEALDAPRETAPAPAPATPRRTPPQEPIDDNLVAIRAPMLGTFYRAPSPNDPPFVEVGDTVWEESTVCLVEVMKLFQSVKAGVAGTIKKIVAENGSMVEYGQVLLLIDPKVSAAKK